MAAASLLEPSNPATALSNRGNIHRRFRCRQIPRRSDATIGSGGGLLGRGFGCLGIHGAGTSCVGTSPGGDLLGGDGSSCAGSGGGMGEVVIISRNGFAADGFPRLACSAALLTSFWNLPSHRQAAGIRASRERYSLNPQSESRLSPYAGLLRTRRQGGDLGTALTVPGLRFREARLCQKLLGKWLTATS